MRFWLAQLLDTSFYKGIQKRAKSAPPPAFFAVFGGPGLVPKRVAELGRGHIWLQLGRRDTDAVSPRPRLVSESSARARTTKQCRATQKCSIFSGQRVFFAHMRTHLWPGGKSKGGEKRTGVVFLSVQRPAFALRIRGRNVAFFPL